MLYHSTVTNVMPRLKRSDKLPPTNCSIYIYVHLHACLKYIYLRRTFLAGEGNEDGGNQSIVK